MSAENNAQAPPRRVIGRPWPKGTSGNAGGRPRTLSEVRELCAKHQRTAVARLLKIVRYGADDVGRAAAMDLLAYAAGRPPQALYAAIQEVGAHDTETRHAALVEMLLSRLAGRVEPEPEPAQVVEVAPALPPAAGDGQP